MNEVVFGIATKNQDPSIKSLLMWPEPQPAEKIKKENTGKWVTETQEAYKYSQNPPPVDFSTIEAQADIKPLEPIQPQDSVTKKVKVGKAIPKPSPKDITRALSNSTYSKKYSKPVFACYGQGNTKQTTIPLFSKRSMKTFNALPYTIDNKTAFVHDTAKIKAFQIKNQRDRSVNKDLNQLKEAVIEHIEIPQENTVLDKNTDEKADFCNQTDPKEITSVCVKCNNHFDQQSFKPYTYQMLDIAALNPKNYKNLPVSHTTKIIPAGKSFKKSNSAYEVIFGDS
jgi:hypothetical protein